MVCWFLIGLVLHLAAICRILFRVDKPCMDWQDAGADQDGLLSEGIQLLRELQEGIEHWKLHRLLSGPYDEGSAVLSIQVAT